MKYKLCCPCLFGIEGFLSQELKDLGCEHVMAENGRVLFEGNAQTVARVNINSRFAERVLLVAGTFEAKSFEALFDQVKRIRWSDYISKSDTFPVVGRSLSSKLSSVPDCQAIIKKAVVESLKETYHISWFEETGPLKRIRFLLMKDQVTVMLDTSGEGLHKRGYRKHSTEAPIKETLAAAMVKIARLRKDGNLIDPFCGSGTILIEGAMMAMNIAPGMRRRYIAESWKEIPGMIWEKERENAKDVIDRTVAFQANGFDIDPEAVALTLDNAKKAGVLTHLKAEQRDIAVFDGSAQYGCVVCNPPYGERLFDVKHARTLYRTMGRQFMSKRGWSYLVISPEPEFEKDFGRRADKRRKLYNGMIQCQLYQYYKYNQRDVQRNA